MIGALLVVLAVLSGYMLGRWRGGVDLAAEEAWYVKTWAELTEAIERVRTDWPGDDDLVWMDREVQAFALALSSHEDLAMSEVIGTALECVAPRTFDREPEIVPVRCIREHVLELV